MLEVSPDTGLVATNSELRPNSAIAGGIFAICTELSAPCMTPEKTLAVPRVMIRDGTASREVNRPLNAPRSAPSPMTIANGSRIPPS